MEGLRINYRFSFENPFYCKYLFHTWSNICHTVYAHSGESEPHGNITVPPNLAGGSRVRFGQRSHWSPHGAERPLRSGSPSSAGGDYGQPAAPACRQVPRQECRNVPRQECNNVPRQVNIVKFSARKVNDP